MREAMSVHVSEHSEDDDTPTADMESIKKAWFGRSQRGRTDQDEEPRGLSQQQMHGWLWKKASHETPDRNANHYVQNIFLDLLGLLIKNTFDIEYQQKNTLGQIRLKRHWCLVGYVDTWDSTLQSLDLKIADVGSKSEFV